MKPTTTQNFNEILKTIQNSKQKALAQVNTTLIELYWEIGKYIFVKSSKENWGKSVVKELADFIKKKEPTIKGFSDNNLWRMKQFYETYKDNEKLSAVLREISWTNNLMILSSAKTDEEREFYLVLAQAEKYSSRELERQIKSGIFERTMLANEKLSAVVRELPQEINYIRYGGK